MSHAESREKESRIKDEIPLGRLLHQLEKKKKKNHFFFTSFFFYRVNLIN